MHLNDRSYGKRTDMVEVIRELRRRVTTLEKHATNIPATITPDWVDPTDAEIVRGGVLIDVDADWDAIVRAVDGDDEDDGVTFDATVAHHLRGAVTPGDYDTEQVEVVAVKTAGVWWIVAATIGSAGGSGGGVIEELFGAVAVTDTDPSEGRPITPASAGTITAIHSTAKEGALVCDLLVDGEPVAWFTVGIPKEGLSVRVAPGQEVAVRARTVGAKRVRIIVTIERR